MMSSSETEYQGPPALEQPYTTTEASPNVALNAPPFPRSDPPSPKDRKSPGLPPPGLPTPAFVSPLFYETARNTRPPKISPTPSSTGPTRGANSSPDVIQPSKGCSMPVTPMSALNDATGGDSGHRPDPADVRESASLRAPPDPPHQRSFQPQSFPSAPYYPARSGPPQDQTYATHSYGQRPGFMGQYMSSRPPSLSMALQSPVQFGYSQSFPHPGIHARDTSGSGVPFSPVQPLLPQNRGWGYQQQPGSALDATAGDHDSRPGSGYTSTAGPQFAAVPGPSQPLGHAPRTTTPHISHHGFPPLHFPASPTHHYPGYPAHSFDPSLYTYAPAPPTGPYSPSFYRQPPASPEDASSSGGTWWYVPPGRSQQFDPSVYHRSYAIPGYQQMNPPEFDPYAAQASLGPGSPSSAFTGPSGQQPLTIQMPPSSALPPREHKFFPSPVATRAGPLGLDLSHVPAQSPASLKKRSPLDTKSPSPPAASPSAASPPATSRRSYHPNPPPNRSEWVMWVGNVPSDATHDELWRFFNQPAPSYPPPPGTSAVLSSRQVQSLPYPDSRNDVWGGVSSVFLISRSNCAFVNFETAHHLERAVLHFNGKPVRPTDSRCPRLVCRVRRRDDDLKAGVGGQRGMGLHTRWVAEQKGREQGRERERGLKATQSEKADNAAEESEGEAGTYNVNTPPTSPSSYLAPSSSSDPSPPIQAVLPPDETGLVPIPPAPRSSSDRVPLRQGSSGNQSFASTNSGFLTTHFPKRYFILKSLTQYDLNLSLERGVWATQQHNEGILDQAFRTSNDVFLIFGANKSGEFFGYARMAGPVINGEHVDRISWACRPSGSTSVPGRLGSSPPEVIKEEDELRQTFLSPGEGRMVGESPASITPGQAADLQRATSSSPGVVHQFDGEVISAPELHQPHRSITHRNPLREPEIHPDPPCQPPEAPRLPKAISEPAKFSLNPHAPGDAAVATQMRRNLAGKSLQAISDMDMDAILRKDTYGKEDELRHQGRRQQGRATASTANTPAAENFLSTSSAEQGRPNREANPEDKAEGWGREFKIEWIRTERLPFHRTRHLRNPWNHDREVKVSRDGTELEPGVGQRLLDEWNKPVEPSPPTSPSRGRGSKPSARVTSEASGAGTVSKSSLSSKLYRAGAGDGTSSAALGGAGLRHARGVGQS